MERENDDKVEEEEDEEWVVQRWKLGMVGFQSLVFATFLFVEKKLRKFPHGTCQIGRAHV